MPSMVRCASRFLPSYIWPGGRIAEPSPLATFQLRTAGGAPEALGAAVKSAVHAMDPRISLEFTTLALRVGKSLEREQPDGVLSAISACSPSRLAAIGLYGTMADRVARRRNEIGLRIALGAHPAQVSRKVLTEAARMILVGLAAGVAATLGALPVPGELPLRSHSERSLTLAIAAALLLGTGLLASYLPARRASGIDPIAALRRE